MTQWRALVVEDDGLTRTSVAAALRLQGLDVVGEADSASTAVQIAREKNPDVAVLDLDLGSGPNGGDIAIALRRLNPAIGIVVLTTYDSPRLLSIEAPELPLRTVFLRKRDVHSVDDLMAAVRTAMEPRNRGVVHTPGMADSFTDPQLQIMRAVADGLTNAEIARRRDVSERAVEQMMRRIAQKLELPGEQSSFNQRVQITRAYLEMTGNVSR
jgi:DNA-binding NarL/FixJ family response regulator